MRVISGIANFKPAGCFPFAMAAAAEGFYKAEINRTEWEVPKRYQTLTAVGSGAYGQVW